MLEPGGGEQFAVAIEDRERHAHQNQRDSGSLAHPVSFRCEAGGVPGHAVTSKNRVLET